jgi:GxxExxY protein
MKNIIFEEESYQIMGACFEVYNQKGFGFTEPVYQECLEIELELRKIPFVAQPRIQLCYKERILDQFFRPDFICFGKIIVEIKSVASLTDAHISQTLNYLSATGFELSILVNFGTFPKLNYKRIAGKKSEEPVVDLRKEIDSWTK